MISTKKLLEKSTIRLSNKVRCTFTSSQLRMPLYFVSSNFSKLLSSASFVSGIIRPRHCRSAATYSRQTFPVDDLSVSRSVGLSVCPVHCGKKADLIPMPFGILGWTGPGMIQVVNFGDLSTERGTFVGEFAARHCNQWGLYGIRVRQRRDAALFPNYFEQTCLYCHRTS